MKKRKAQWIVFWVTFLALLPCLLIAIALESSDCMKAFRDAAEVPDFQDSHADIFPAYSACQTVEEFEAAAETYPEALDAIVTASTYARNMCESYPELTETQICQELREDEG